MLKSIRDLIIGAFRSRIAIAVFGLFFLAFSAHSLFAPTRFPPVGVPPLTQLGLAPHGQIAPPNIQLPDFIDAETQTRIRVEVERQVRARAPEVKKTIWEEVEAFFKNNPEAIRAANAFGAGVSLVLMLVAMWLQVGILRREAEAGLRQDVYAFGKFE